MRPGGPPWAAWGPPWHDHTRRGPGPWLVLVVGVPQVLGTVLAANGQTDRRDLDALAIALLLAGPLALAFRARWPLGVLVVTTVTTGVYYGAGYPHGPAFLAFGAAAIGAVLRGHRYATWVIAGAGFLGALLLERRISGGWLSVSEITTYVAWLLVLLGLAELVRARRDRFIEYRRAGAEESRRRREESRRTASEERLQLARELHDVLAHNVSLINVQASTALHLLDEQPERARTALTAIKEASRETLHELRATVDSLRGDGERAPRSPAPGLDRLDELVAQNAEAGLRVDVERVGAVVALPARVDLAAYRIVQEALTNVRRHSGTDRARVVLSYAEASLRIEVTDSGKGAPAGVDVVEGHGLRGMRERASALGGTFEAGATDEGFAVTVVLPLGAS